MFKTTTSKTPAGKSPEVRIIRNNSAWPLPTWSVRITGWDSIPGKRFDVFTQSEILALIARQPKQFIIRIKGK